MSVKYRLSEFLKLNKIKQKELAEIFGLTSGTISGIISGRSDVTTSQLITLASKYKDLDIRWLLTGEKAPLKNQVNLEDKAKNAEKQNIVNEPCPFCEKLNIEKIELYDKLIKKGEDLDRLNEDYRYLLENGIPKKEKSSTSYKEAL